MFIKNSKCIQHTNRTIHFHKVNLNLKKMVYESGLVTLLHDTYSSVMNVCEEYLLDICSLRYANIWVQFMTTVCKT